MNQITSLMIFKLLGGGIHKELETVNPVKKLRETNTSKQKQP